MVYMHQDRLWIRVSYHELSLCVTLCSTLAGGLGLWDGCSLRRSLQMC